MVPLVKALMSQGHEVTVATGPELVERVRRAGLTAVGIGPTAPEAAGLAINDPVFSEGQEPWRLGATMFARVMAPRRLPELQRLIDEQKPDLVLQAPVDLAAPLAAASRGVPTLTYGTGLVLEQPLMSKMAEWVRPLWAEQGLAGDDNAGMYRDSYLNPAPATLQPDLGPATGISRSIRPHVPGSPDAPLPELGNRTVLYVSLGTVPVFNRRDLFDVLLTAVADLDADVVVTVGHNNDPATFKAPANVHIEQWVSLAALLPRCSAVLCHAGAGTTLAALAHRLPLVLLPQGADQFPTAAACRAAGVAEVITPDRFDAKTVHQALSTVLGGEHLLAALRLGDEIAAMPSPEEVAHDVAGAAVR
jgi:UDP:flavonoid glycosyltransferase YjiC (YdhE family)